MDFWNSSVTLITVLIFKINFCTETTIEGWQGLDVTDPNILLLFELCFFCVDSFFLTLAPCILLTVDCFRPYYYTMQLISCYSGDLLIKLDWCITNALKRWYKLSTKELFFF